MFNRIKPKDDYDKVNPQFKDVKKQSKYNRKWGMDTLEEYKKERFILYLLFVIIFFIEIAIGVLFIQFWVFILAISFGLALIVAMLSQKYIKIPYQVVLNVELNKEYLIDSIGIYYIPLHCIGDWDIIGNTPPFRLNDGTLIWICDVFDKENKYIELPFDERFSNLRYSAHKETFIEIKKEIKWYAMKNLRRIYVGDVTAYGIAEDMIDKMNNAIYEEPEEYFRRGTVVSDKYSELNQIKDTLTEDETEIIKRIRNKKEFRNNFKYEKEEEEEENNKKVNK